MILKRDYDQIIRENFDLSDKYTRQYIVTLEDAQQEQLIDALSAALYDKIVAKVDEIDFGTIPKSRGDITKVQGFENNKKCIDIIRQLVVQYHQNPAPVDIISAAIQNIADRTTVYKSIWNECRVSNGNVQSDCIIYFQICILSDCIMY